MKGIERKETAPLKSKGESIAKGIQQGGNREVVLWVHRPISQSERRPMGARLCGCRKVCQAYV